MLVTKPEKRVFYPALDGLRALAFLLVFFGHYYALPWGWAGVNVFFVLSGFLITGILFDSREQPNAARNFYVRRTLRIFPLYYGVLLALLILDPLLHWNWSWQWLAWPLYLGNFLHFASPVASVPGTAWQLAGDGMLSSKAHSAVLFLGHFWTLCVEEQFYLLWPWVVFLVRSKRILLWLCGSAVVVTPFLRLAAEASAPAWMLHAALLLRATPFELDSLLLGGLVALLWRGPHRHAIITVGKFLAMIGGLVGLLYLVVTLHPSAMPNWRTGYRYPAWQFTWGITFLNMFSAGLLVCCLSSEGAFIRMLCLKPLRWLGRVSYGAYVWHDIFHNLYSDAILKLGSHWHFLLIHTYDATLTVAFVMTLLISWLSYRFVETPFLKLKDRWAATPRLAS